MVDVRDLRRSFGKREVLGGVNLGLARGERVALRGANGSGKSTLLRCVLGAMTPTAGTVHVGGHPAGSAAARELIGATLSQDRSFYLRLTGRSNLLFFARLRSPSLRVARREVDRIVDELEIGDIAAKRVARCSTGMIQQLGFARALLGEPRVLLLDEPTRSLDHEATDRMWAALARRPHAALLIATHRDEDSDHCHRTHALAPQP